VLYNFQNNFHAKTLNHVDKLQNYEPDCFNHKLSETHNEALERDWHIKDIFFLKTKVTGLTSQILP